MAAGNLAGAVIGMTISLLYYSPHSHPNEGEKSNKSSLHDDHVGG